jgi:hypothetical protein
MRVRQDHFQRLGLGSDLRIRRRKPRESGLAGEGAVALVSQVQHAGAVRQLDRQGRNPVVAAPSDGEFERHRMTEPVRETVKIARHEVRVRLALGRDAPKYTCPSQIVLENAHDVADEVVAEVELSSLRRPLNRHQIPAGGA